MVLVVVMDKVMHTIALMERFLVLVRDDGGDMVLAFWIDRIL